MRRQIIVNYIFIAKLLIFCFSIIKQFSVCNSSIFIANWSRLISISSQSITSVGRQSSECIHANRSGRCNVTRRQFKIQEQHTESGSLQCSALTSDQTGVGETRSAPTTTAASATSRRFDTNCLSANRNFYIFGSNDSCDSASTTNRAINRPWKRNKCYSHFASFFE